MRKLLQQFQDDVWGSWSTWLHLGGIAFGIMVIMIYMVWLNRADYQRRLDAASLRMVNEVTQKLNEIDYHLNVIDQQNQRSVEDRRALHDQNERSTRERDSMKKSLEKIEGAEQPKSN